MNVNVYIILGIMFSSLFVCVFVIMSSTVFQEHKIIIATCEKILDMKKVYNNLSSDLKDYLYLKCGTFY